MVYIYKYIDTMSINKTNKLNHLLELTPNDTVLSTRWLVKMGYSHSLQQKYRSGGWFKPLGKGALYRGSPGYLGGLYALQKQLNLSVHVGAKSALALRGEAHYLELNQQTITLFLPTKEKLPNWFSTHDWGLGVKQVKTDFIDTDIGLADFSYKSFSIKISTPARAMLEQLYLVKSEQDYIEAYELMEGLNTLRPKEVQLLLQASNSAKVNRLFLYLAQKAGHGWFKHLDISKVPLGTGKRQLHKGVYIGEYQITIPKSLEEYT